MEKQYIAPELTIVGEAEEIVLGGGGGGNDFFNEDSWSDTEFATDTDNVEAR